MQRLFLLLLAPLLLVGCGYHLGEIRPTPMRSVRTLAVPSFKNNTYEPRVEVLLANALIRELQVDGTYRIVNEGVADAILSCTLVRAERRSIRSVVDNVLATSEFELILEANYEVQDRVTGAILLEGQARGRTTFFPTGDLQTDERQAISVAASRLGQSITSRVAEGW
jgi:outer membrane lipopolysaccharide assembly protein LptE/RlpB